MLKMVDQSDLTAERLSGFLGVASEGRLPLDTSCLLAWGPQKQYLLNFFDSFNSGPYEVLCVRVMPPGAYEGKC